MKSLVVAFLVALSPSTFSEISWNNEIDWIVASSANSSSSHLIEWKNTLQNDSDCTFGANNNVRTRFSSSDDELYALLLSAKMAGHQVSFFYKVTTDLESVSGHGSGCEIINAWIE